MTAFPRSLVPLTGSLALLAGVCTAGCSQAPKGYKVYGASLKQANTVPAKEVFDHPDKYDGKQVRLASTIDEVCSKRGCWLTVREGDEILRARFVESGECINGYFVPRDAAGHDVILEGTVRVEEIDEELARHYLEDAGAPREKIEAIVGPQKALGMVCTSVAIKDAETLGEPFKPE